MVIGERLKALREAKQLSQGDIEKRIGLLRCYISRVENGHTVPAIETLEKLARGMEVALYQLFYDGEKAAVPPNLLKRKGADEAGWGNAEKMHASSVAFVPCSAASKIPTAACCSTWRKKWLAT